MPSPQKVWPGWTGYRELPFLFEFENQLQVLVGHPNPPKPFELVPGLTIGGHLVAADRSKMSAVKVEPPLIAGGGPNNFGTTADGTPVYTVRINVRSARSAGDAQAEDHAAAEDGGEGPHLPPRALPLLPARAD